MAIRKILKKHKTTAKRVSEQTGIKYRTVLKYSNGERNLSIKNAKKIAEVLHIDWWELFKEEQGENTDAS